LSRIVVPFAGDGSGTEELTWGQRALWRSMQRTGRSLAMAGAQRLPAGTTIDLVVAGLRFVLSRHQALRTRLRFGPDGRPLQALASSGEVALDLVDAAGADPAAVAEQIRQRYEHTPYDYLTEWPVRMTVVCRAGEPSHVVGGYCHLAVDAFGLAELAADLSTMDVLTGRSDRLLAGVQPLELARRQREPAAVRQSEAALRYLERTLRALPSYGLGRVIGEPSGPQPRHHQLRYRSPAALLALRTLAARKAGGSTAALLAAYAVTLARHGGICPLPALLMASNRFRPGFAGAITPLSQVSPLLLDVSGVSFGEAVTRAGRAALQAYKHAYYDPDRRAELIARLSRERGADADLVVYFNDRRQPDRSTVDGPHATAAELRAALPVSQLSWLTPPGLPTQLLDLEVDEAPDALELTLSADTWQLPPTDMVTLVRGIEAVLVEAAADPATATRR
jgi:hypothetical protein